MNGLLKALILLTLMVSVTAVALYFSCGSGKKFDFKTFKCVSKPTPSKPNKFKCDKGECALGGPDDAYDTLDDCQKNCQTSPTVNKYKCDNGECSLGGPNDPYDTIEECKQNCKSATPMYSCNADCNQDPNGTYSSVKDCLNGCYPDDMKITIDLTQTPYKGIYQGGAMSYIQNSGHTAQFVWKTPEGFGATINVDFQNANLVVTQIFVGPNGTQTSTLIDTPYQGNDVYTATTSNRLLLVVVLPKFCNGKGLPDGNGNCVCVTGFEKATDCKCPTNFGGPNCSMSRVGHCSGNGVPDSSGNCICDPGHRGTSCQFSDDVQCNNNGKFDPTTGKCVCNPGYDILSNCRCPPDQNGPSCQFSRKETCNGNGYPDVNGACTCDAMPPNCTSVDSKCACNSCILNDSSIPDFGGYSYQKFVLSSTPGEGCVPNPNPWAWADIVGASAHKSGTDSNLCLNGASTYRYDKESLSYNSCALTPSAFNNLKGKSITSQVSGKSYDFVKIDDNTTISDRIEGPYTYLLYNSGKNNDSYFLAPPDITSGTYHQGTDESTNQSNGFVNDPYIQSIFNYQKSAISSLGNSVGNTHVLPAYLNGNSDNPNNYSRMGYSF